MHMRQTSLRACIGSAEKLRRWQTIHQNVFAERKLFKINDANGRFGFINTGRLNGSLTLEALMQLNALIYCLTDSNRVFTKRPYEYLFSMQNKR